MLKDGATADNYRLSIFDAKLVSLLNSDYYVGVTELGAVCIVFPVVSLARVVTCDQLFVDQCDYCDRLGRL